jgi:hypothetical protein
VRCSWHTSIPQSSCESTYMEVLVSAIMFRGRRDPRIRHCTAERHAPQSAARGIAHQSTRRLRIVNRDSAATSDLQPLQLWTPSTR